MQKVQKELKKLFIQKDTYEVKELSEILPYSRQAIHKSLKELVEDGYIYKIGSAPKVFYKIVVKPKIQNKNLDDVVLTSEQTEILNKEFIYIKPDGTKNEGVSGFIEWCKSKSNQSVQDTAKEYITIYNKFAAHRSELVIDGTRKFTDTFKSDTHVSKVFFRDFYSIDRFGKTKLGQMLLYAKKSNDKKLIRQITQEVKASIAHLIETQDIDAVGFIPPTEKRELQFMKELQKNLNLSLPVIDIVKVTTDIIVPQKTLSKIEDRIRNAEETIFVSDKRGYNNVLLIDDAIGSGATLNETAKKLIKDKNAKNVIGFAVTGSANGFDVVKEA